MGYIEANLTKDEQVIARIKHSWAGLVSTVIGFMILLSIAIVFLKMGDIIRHYLSEEDIYDFNKFYRNMNPMMISCGCVFLIFAFFMLLNNIIEMKSAQLVVTNKRLLGRRGFISKQTTDIVLSSLDTITAGNCFLGAIFHYGYIQVASPASAATRFNNTTRYNYIANTMDFRQAVLKAIDKAKEEERNAQAEAQAKAMREAMQSND